jgi:hypothetical protein
MRSANSVQVRRKPFGLTDLRLLNATMGNLFLEIMMVIIPFFLKRSSPI